MAKKEKKLEQIVFLSLVGVLVLLIGAAIVFSLTSRRSDGPPPLLELSPTEYEAGKISMRDGNVEFVYEIKNEGEGDLIIDRIWTTCGCTVAKLRVGKKTSREFGMNAYAPFWSATIPPGEIGYLEVSFDPGYHGPSGTGFAVRAVYLSTNDPQGEVRVVFSADVTP